jgi:hypothetical protein
MVRCKLTGLPHSPAPCLSHRRLMWQDQVRSALVERDVKEKAQAHVAAQYRRLVNLTLSLKERNGALLSAGGPGTTSKGAVE